MSDDWGTMPSEQDWPDRCDQDDVETDSVSCDLCSARFDCATDEGIVLDSTRGDPWPDNVTFVQLKLCYVCANRICKEWRDRLSESGVCEHGEREGDWCSECNRAYKMAIVNPDNSPPDRP